MSGVRGLFPVTKRYAYLNRTLKEGDVVRLTINDTYELGGAASSKYVFLTDFAAHAPEGAALPLRTAVHATLLAAGMVATLLRC